MLDALLLLPLQLLCLLFLPLLAFFLLEAKALLLLAFLQFLLLPSTQFLLLTLLEFFLLPARSFFSLQALLFSLLPAHVLLLSSLLFLLLSTDVILLLLLLYCLLLTSLRILFQRPLLFFLLAGRIGLGVAIIRLVDLLAARRRYGLRSLSFVFPWRPDALLALAHRRSGRFDPLLIGSRLGLLGSWDRLDHLGLHS